MRYFNPNGDPGFYAGLSERDQAMMNSYDPSLDYPQEIHQNSYFSNGTGGAAGGGSTTKNEGKSKEEIDAEALEALKKSKPIVLSEATKKIIEKETGGRLPLGPGR
jgi:hypothetical protein